MIKRLNELRAERTVRVERLGKKDNQGNSFKVAKIFLNSLPEAMEADGKIHLQWCTAVR